MKRLSRRKWMESISAAFLAATGKSSGKTSPVYRPTDTQETPPGNAHLELSDFQPKSMLHVPETKVPRARFPVIDIHTHLSWGAVSKNGVFLGEKMQFLSEPSDLMEVMDRKNVRTMVDLTGGIGAGLEDTIRK